jgi:hypothetical protein
MQPNRACRGQATEQVLPPRHARRAGDRAAPSTTPGDTKATPVSAAAGAARRAPRVWSVQPRNSASVCPFRRPRATAGGQLCGGHRSGESPSPKNGRGRGMTVPPPGTWRAEWVGASGQNREFGGGKPEGSLELCSRLVVRPTASACVAHLRLRLAAREVNGEHRTGVVSCSLAEGGASAQAGRGVCGHVGRGRLSIGQGWQARGEN